MNFDESDKEDCLSSEWVTSTVEFIKFNPDWDKTVGFRVGDTATEGSECPDGYWMCSNGEKCIYDSWVCDVFTDCYDGSDETNCPESATEGSECPDGYWMCSNGEQCIDDSWVCDGYTNCYDGSDEFETNCPVSDCGYGYWMCSNYEQCIPDSYVCDGETNCYDGSDELNCPTTDPGCWYCSNLTETPAVIWGGDSQDKTQTSWTIIGIVILIAALLLVAVVLCICKKVSRQHVMEQHTVRPTNLPIVVPVQLQPAINVREEPLSSDPSLPNVAVDNDQYVPSYEELMGYPVGPPIVVPVQLQPAINMREEPLSSDPTLSNVAVDNDQYVPSYEEVMDYPAGSR
ncbi:low-density lipoprotein receptor class A domain-containing protein 3-like [Bolinopsis microptera]|uniref:low-density lipoprotein receptor class A domain-containing protein 3-like n=1 Tax=Bolinopsis microptera TaxID=2820187 RepID=UPI0030793349